MSEISSIVRILLSDVLYCIIRLAHVSRSVINKSTGYFFEVVFMWKFLTEVANRVWVKMYWPASEDHIACTIVPCVAGNEKPLKRRAFLGTAKAGTDARGSKFCFISPLFFTCSDDGSSSRLIALARHMRWTLDGGSGRARNKQRPDS